MPLREHLAELRRRIVISAIAIGLGTVAGWYLYSPIFQEIQQPLKDVAAAHHIQANINFSDIMQAFNLHLQVAVYLGIVVASPVWLYQGWAFVLPGLTKREKWHAIAFASVGTPLFLAGIGVGWMVLPNAVTFFVSFAEEGTTVLPSAGQYIGFVTRLLMVFGIAFLLPMVLVALNLANLLSAKAMGAGWRVAVFVIFLFAAIASPTPDAGSMLALAVPMCGLYAVAVGFSTIVDRRRAKRGWGDLSDDEASPLEAPAPLDEPAPIDHEPIRSSSADSRGDITPESGAPRDRFDDIT